MIRCTRFGSGRMNPIEKFLKTDKKKYLRKLINQISSSD